MIKIEQPTNFTHLETHSYYTLLGSPTSVSKLVDRATSEGMSHLALTDTNALYGVLAFAKACQEAGLQAIIGMTIMVVGAETPDRLVLLATGPAGYRSLCRLSSLIQGSPDRERLAARGLSWAALNTHKEGLICLSGGRRGQLTQLLQTGDEQTARDYTHRLASIYGENAYLSLELHQPQDEGIAQEIVSIGQRVGLPCVAVQPVYCLTQSDRTKLKLLAAIDKNCRLDELPPSALPASGDPNIDLHWLSPTEITGRFARFPEAVSAVAEIAARCSPALPDGKPIWPVLKLPTNQTPDQRLTEVAQDGLSTRYGDEMAMELQPRLQRELTSINRHGYAPLFLIVADIVHFARQEHVPVSTRGSVANSLVAYCTEITTVDPIEHNLLFERFLNPARSDPPDIDLDFCSRRRDNVLDYVRKTYGADRVALVATISTMRPRSAVRETAKAHGLSEPQIKTLVAALPRGRHPDARRRDRRSVEEIVADIADPRQKEIVRLAYDLIGQPHHMSVHPGGIVITPGPLTDIVPVQWAPKGFLITQFDHQDIEALGLPKIDLLGISALTVIADAAQLVQEREDKDFDPINIPLDDLKTGDLLVRGETIGVFQCESEGARKTLRQLQTSSVQDLAVANAFFKPGPATGGMARNFVRRYRGQEMVSYLHPTLEPILDSTKGVLLFQEQILRVDREIAGLSWNQADYLRRGMSKIRADEMAPIQQEFIRGCQQPEPAGPAFTPQQAQTLWEQVVAFGGYGFNQGHATAYANVSYQLAYLKTHWPAELFCARLANRGGFHHQAIYIAEAIRLGIRVKPPHINHSFSVFSLSNNTTDKTLWMGLGQVRDLRRASIKAIINARQERLFIDLRDVLARLDLHPKEITHLIQCGALDSLASNRATLLAELEGIDQAGSALQLALPFTRPEISAEAPKQRLNWETFILGLPVSVHPLTGSTNRLSKYTSLSQLPEQARNYVTIAGFRLPGWTGGQGFYLGDGQTFILVKGNKSLKSPSPWQPVLVQGRWLSDEFDTVWFQAERLSRISVFAN